MRVLDLDLDFFLNDNAYSSGHANGRLGPEYQPWSILKVKHFLEQRCGLSPDMPVFGRTVESHDGVLDFWRQLVKTSSLMKPFDVIHIDAHPDLWTGDVLYLTSGRLYLGPETGLAKLKQKLIHAGNYLTFAIASGWIASLVWVPLRQHPKNRPAWDADARSILNQLKKQKLPTPHTLPAGEKGRGVPFQVIPWQKFKANGNFDCIALSRSPQFTPPESDALIPVIEKYMKPI
jgi:hypothetical protein